MMSRGQKMLSLVKDVAAEDTLDAIDMESTSSAELSQHAPPRKDVYSFSSNESGPGYLEISFTGETVQVTQNTSDSLTEELSKSVSSDSTWEYSGESSDATNISAKEIMVLDIEKVAEGTNTAKDNSGTPSEFPNPLREYSFQPDDNNDHLPEVQEINNISRPSTSYEVLQVAPVVTEPDRTIINFGKVIQNDDTSTTQIEILDSTRTWIKKNACPYCLQEVSHFSRHLFRKHSSEGSVQKIKSLPSNHQQRKQLFNAIRRQGNYRLKAVSNVIKPIRRTRKVLTTSDDYVVCDYCLGYFKKNYLRRHRRKCELREKKAMSNQRERHLASSQSFLITSMNDEFYRDLRLKNDVFPHMQKDEIAEAAMKDFLICTYGESQLSRHKKAQVVNSISNRMREMGRLLLALKKSTGTTKLFDVMKPSFYDAIVRAAKEVSGYNSANKSFAASSLALHFGTRLKQVCDCASKLIIQKHPLVANYDCDGALKDVKRLRHLLSTQWNNDISSLALKNLTENNFEKPKLLPLTSDVIKFQKYVTEKAEIAVRKLTEKKKGKTDYRNLSECTLALALLLNRKRIGEIQYLEKKTYLLDRPVGNQKEFLQSLTESEKILSSSFKRVVTMGKGSKPVAILFPKKLQHFINVLLECRENHVPSENAYLFANPNTKNRWLSGYHVLRKLASEANVENQELFTSTRLRKHIATVLQVMNLNGCEMEQFAAFMGHTKKTHETYYRLPQDIFQTAKVAKLLLAINKGTSIQFKDKQLDEIELSDYAESDSDDDFTTPLPKLSRNLETFNEENKHSNTLEENAQMNVEDEHRSIQTEEENHKQNKKIIIKIPWTTEQKTIVNSFFKDHIRNKRPPKKQEVEELISKNKELFKNKNWVKIKAYVYNCYKDK